MILLCTAALAVFTTVDSPPPPARAQAAVKSVLDGDYQQRLPGEADHATARDRSKGSGRIWWRKDKRPGPGARDHERERLQPVEGGPLSTIASALMWVLVAVAVVLIGFLLFQELAGYQADPELADDARPGDHPDRDAAVVARPLGDAEELAGRGEFGQAIHILLLRTLEELTRRVQIRVPPSMTSREILRRVALPDEAHLALADLVTAVEVSHFGAAVPSEADYHMCRDRFQRFAAAYRRRLA